MEDIYFFLHVDDYERVLLLSGLQGYDFKHPQINWVWSTYYRLKQKGYTNIHLVDKIPDKGIIVMASNQRFYFKKFSKDALVIVTVADSPPWFYNQINISQNRFQHSEYPNVFKYPVWMHIPHWPQPNLIPRDSCRGDEFETVAFFGDRSQLAPEISGSEFANELREIGLKFKIVEQDFNDYSGVDCVIAIRSFSKARILNKPYSKLLNAWLAGVPAIVGKESSFQSIKKTGLDFIAVETKAELIEALQMLKNNPALRQQMIANGHERAKDFTEEATLKQWEDLLFNKAQTIYKEWTSKGKVGRGIFYADLFLSRSYRSLKRRLIKAN